MHLRDNLQKDKKNFEIYTYTVHGNFDRHYEKDFSAVVLLTFPKQALVFTCLQYKSFENTAGKGEIARNEQFLLSHSVFYPFGEPPAVFIKFKIVIFQYELVKKFVISEWVKCCFAENLRLIN